MTQLLATRRRLVRVRAIQLKAHTLSLAAARSQLDRLERHKTAIEILAGSSGPAAGAGYGFTIASAIELRGRLLAASQSLNGRLGAERTSVAQQESHYLAADRDKQMAEKLLERATRAAERAMERRRLVPVRRYADDDGTAS